jgi:HlyD family secretion protein
MDREIPSHIKRNRKIRVYSIGIISFLFVVLALIGFRSLLKASVRRDMIRTAFAERGPIQATITASGIVIPEYEQSITSPIRSKIEKVYHKAGERIQTGEPILELDREFVQLTYDQLSDELELKKNKLTQLQLDLDKRLIDLQTQREVKELKIEYFESRVELEKQLHKIGGGTTAGLKIAELDLEIARVEFEQLEKEIENQRQSAVADLNELELQIRIQENRLNEVRRQMELAETKAERDGIVTYVNDVIGAAVNPGDVVARVADLGSFRVQGTISDINASKLINGGRVIVRVDEEEIGGTISSIRPTIENGIVTFLVDLDEKSHEALRSNLRIDVFVVTASKDDVIRVTNGPFVNGSGLQDIFVMEGDRAVRRTVTVGAMNFDYVEIVDNIEIGEEVIISDMEDYIHQSEVKIINE